MTKDVDAVQQQQHGSSDDWQDVELDDLLAAEANEVSVAAIERSLAAPKPLTGGARLFGGDGSSDDDDDDLFIAAPRKPAVAVNNMVLRIVSSACFVRLAHQNLRWEGRGRHHGIPGQEHGDSRRLRRRPVWMRGALFFFSADFFCVFCLSVFSDVGYMVFVFVFPPAADGRESALG